MTVQMNDFESVRADSVVNDGEVHFVSVEVAEDRMVLYVAAQKQGDVEIGMANVRAGDAVYVGGLLDSEATAVFGGYFKGCIQDLRINDTRLQFFGLDASVRTYPLQFMENVISGCSGDNACSVSICLQQVVRSLYF